MSEPTHSNEPAPPLPADPAATRTAADPAATAGDDSPTATDPGLPTGLLAGRYILGAVLGEGGMGTVYRAEQIHPVKRPVAVKLIKAGMDSARVVARFEAERQALALMDHPHIAKVLDAGTTDRPSGERESPVSGRARGAYVPRSGVPFFVMELVEGVPLTEYCDAHRLSVRDRLNLFVKVCQGVQHAHQKGVMHRDLKPSNILVAEVDGKPVPKVIDFGLAKALQAGALPDVSADMAFGSALGTPLYMAPEQADPGAADVDTRADVYALGVILYELLVGSTPLTHDTVRKAALGELLRLVREGATPAPTARLRAAADLPNIAAVRNTEPGRLSKEIRGDLEWITLKCLEKDRTRRYETANGLAADVGRFLADEPVLATPPSRLYKLRKFVRRNRGPVLAGALVLLALLGGVIGTSWALVRAVAAERLAGQRLTDLEQAHAQTRQALATSEAERTRAEDAEKQAKAVSDYLVDAFRKPDPFSDGKDLKVVELLDKAVAKLNSDRQMDPLTRARLQDTLAQTYFGLGLYDKAVPLLEQSRATYEARHGVDHADTLGVMHRLMFTLGHAGRTPEAIALGERVLNRRKALLGADDPDTLLTMTQLAGQYWKANRLDEAITMSEQALAGQRKRLAPDHDNLPNSISNLAMLYQVAGRTTAAVRLHEEAVTLRKAKKGLDHPDTLLAVNLLGQAYREAGRTDEAIALQRDTLEQIRGKLGDAHPRTLSAMSGLARTYRSCGKTKEALAINEQLLELARKAPEPDTETLLNAMQDLAMVYSDLRRTADSLAMLRETVTTATKHFGVGSPETHVYQHNLGVALRQAGKPAEAVEVFEQVYAARKATADEGDPERQKTITQLASAYVAVGRVKDAIALLEPLLAVQMRRLDPDHRDLLVTMANLALAYGSVGRTADAVGLHEQVAAAFRKKYGPTHPDTQTVVRYLGTAYREDNRLADAERTFRDLLTVTRPASPADSLNLASTLAGLGDVLLAAKKYEAAEEALRECLTIREKKEAENWRTFLTRSMLGEALAGQRKYAAAEPLLVTGYEGLKAREKAIPPNARQRLPEALDRLVALYTAMNKPDEAAKWRAERAKYPTVAPPPREAKR